MNPSELRTKFYNLATAKTPWYKIMNQAAGPTQIHIFNSIGGLGVSAEDFVTELNEVKGPIELHINSEGGEVFQAKTIYNALNRRADVTVIIDSIAASAASFIAMAASPGKLFMTKVASMMIHDGQTLAYGSAQELMTLVDALNRESDTIAGIYADRAGKPVEYFRDIMRKEKWYNAQGALEEKLCDGIIDPRSGAITNAASVPYVSERQARHEPMTGRHIHDHAAYEAGDHDDGMHYHHHVHNNDSDHHHTHQPGMGHEDGHANPMVGAEMHDHTPDGQHIVMAAEFPEAQFYNRTFTTEERRERAKDGRALSDGSYPIDNCQDAENARTAYGRAPEGKRSAVASHIRKRESALKCSHGEFKPGSDNTSSLVITDEEAASFAASIRL